MDNTTKTIVYSFTAGYMVSQFDILGFAMGCGLMIALNFIPEDIKKLNMDIFNNVVYIVGNVMNKNENQNENKNENENNI